MHYILLSVAWPQVVASVVRRGLSGEGRYFLSDNGTSRLVVAVQVPGTTIRLPIPSAPNCPVFAEALLAWI